MWKEKSMYGKKYMGIERSTFVIDEQGKIAKIFAKVKPEGHRRTGAGSAGWLSYQIPISFHHPKPTVIQIARFTRLTMNPICHHFLSDT